MLLWLLFGVLSTTYVANYFLQTLEDQFPVVYLPNSQKVDAVIVLGGLSRPLSMVTDWPEFSESVDRILIAKQLYQMNRTDYILISGALGYMFRKGRPESETLKEYLQQRIPEEFILIDNRSRNTAQNAMESLAICKEYQFKKVYLVTSAFHMLRAYKVFNKIKKDVYPEIEIFPFPADYRSLRVIPVPEALIPSHGGLNTLTLVIKEISGIIGYWLKGYI